MPIPGMAALGLIGATGKFTEVSGQLLFPQASTITALSQQLECLKNPIALPPPNSLIEAYLKGWLGLDDEGNPDQAGINIFVNMARRHGVAIGGLPQNSGHFEEIADCNFAWKKIIDSSWTRPGVNEAFKARIANLITPQQFELMLRRNGALKGDWEWMLPLMSQRLGIEQLVTVWRRGLITEGQFDAYAKILQYGIKGDIDKLKQITMAIPSPQEMIELYVRGTFNPQIVQQMGLDQELNENKDFLVWAKSQGYGEVAIKDDQGNEIKADFAKQMWYSHWDLPSTSAGYGFYHRFYSASRFGPSPWLKMAPKFEKPELETLFRINSTAPKYRDNYTAMSFNPLNKRDMKNLRTQNKITKSDVYHNFRAIGYADEQANQLTEWIEQSATDARLKPEKEGLKRRTCKAFETGIIDENRMTQVLLGAGWTQDETNLQVKLCTIDMSLGIANEGLTSVKAGFLSGAYTESEARIIMTQLGIIVARADQYIFNWRLKLNSRRRVVAAGEIAKWFIDDIIDITDLVSRLTKLDYNAQDVTRIAQAATLEKAKRIEKAQKASVAELQKQIEKRLREAEKQAKEAEKLRRQREQELKRQQAELAKEEHSRLQKFLSARTEANLRKWLHAKEITEVEIRDTFRLKGWNDSDITRWLDIERKKGK